MGERDREVVTWSLDKVESWRWHSLGQQMFKADPFPHGHCWWVLPLPEESAAFGSLLLMKVSLFRWSLMTPFSTKRHFMVLPPFFSCDLFASPDDSQTASRMIPWRLSFMDYPWETLMHPLSFQTLGMKVPSAATSVPLTWGAQENTQLFLHCESARLRAATTLLKYFSFLLQYFPTLLFNFHGWTIKRHTTSVNCLFCKTYIMVFRLFWNEHRLSWAEIHLNTLLDTILKLRTQWQIRIKYFIKGKWCKWNSNLDSLTSDHQL